MNRLLISFACAGILALPGASRAAEIDFYRQVYPFLKENCISCHNKTTTKAGLNMETPELMIVGGDSGPSIVPGKSAESLLVEASAHSEHIEMPPSKNKTGARDLTSRELALLKQWIDEGAKSSAKEARKVVWQALASTVDPIYTVAMTDDGRYVACGRANRIFLYDLATQRPVTRIGETKESEVPHRALVNSLAFSPDGSRLASGSYREVKIWKRHEVASTAREADPTLAIIASAPFPGGKQLVTADKTGSLIILETATGKTIRKIEKALAPTPPLLAVSPDGATIAALSSGGWSLGLWNVADGKLIAKQTTPDPSLAAKSEAATSKSQAAAKTLAEAESALAEAMAAKTEATAALEKSKAALGATPDEAGKKQIAELQAVLTAKMNSESAARKKVDATKKAAESAKKDADAAAAQLTAINGMKASALAWSGDGQAILTASADKQMRAWAVPNAGASFTPPRLFSGSTAAITSIATGAGGKVLSGGDDNKVRLWNLADGKILKEFSAATTTIALSPDGNYIATGTDDGRVRLWDAAGTQLFDLRGSPEMTARITTLQRTIDREKLEQSWQKAHAAGIEARDKGLVDLLNKAKDAVVAMNKKLPEAEKAIPPLKEARVEAEKKVAEAEAALKNPPEGKTESALESELQKAKVALLAAQTKETDAVAALAAFRSNITDAEANQKKITDTQAANKKAISEAKAAEAAAKKRETDATTALAAANKEATAIGSKPLSLAFSSDSARLATAFADGSIRTWSTVSGTPLEKVSGSASASATLLHQSDGSFLSSRNDGGILTTASAPQWKLERLFGGEEQPDPFADRVNTVAFSPDGKTLATGSGEPSRSGDITLFDISSGKVSATWKERHSDSVVSLDFSPDGKQLASGAADKIARITDIATGEQAGLFEGHTHYVNDVAFRSDGRVLATAGADGVVNSWDLTIGERKKKIEGWTKEVTSLQFIGATDRLVTSAGDNLVRIITDAGSQVRAISELPDFMQAAASTSDGKMIVAGGEDSYLRVWNGADGKEIVSFGMQ